MNKVKKILISCALCCCLLFVTFATVACGPSALPNIPSQPSNTEPKLITTNTYNNLTYEFISAPSNTIYVYEGQKTGSYYTGVDVVFCFRVVFEFNIKNNSSDDLKVWKDGGQLTSNNTNVKFCTGANASNVEYSTIFNFNNLNNEIAGNDEDVYTISMTLIGQKVHYSLDNLNNQQLISFLNGKATNYFNQHFNELKELLKNTIFSLKFDNKDLLRFKINENGIKNTDFSQI